MAGIPTRRVFGGMVYYSAGRHDSKVQAERSAVSLRKQGHRARVVFIHDVGYVVYAVSK